MNERQNQSIWKEKSERGTGGVEFRSADIAVLELSVRSYNCLKRAGCTTIGDVLVKIGEDEGEGLRRIRNLGKRSEVEIIDRIREYHEECLQRLSGIRGAGTSGSGFPGASSGTGSIFREDGGTADRRPHVLVKPARKVWDHEIEEFHLSGASLSELKDCGIIRIRDLYAAKCSREPGWYAVRELFEKI